LFSQREIHSFRSAAERALWLNRMDGSSMAFLGMLLAYAGDWERGCTLAETGMRLNPQHLEYYWTAILLNANA
jgi:hypothetical protein